MEPSITVITPSYNQADYIESAISSVLSQGVESLEYLIVDGGSTDGTLEKIRRLGAQYPGRFKWISEPDLGQADAVNKGIALTKGAIIGWLNSDDVYYDGALEAVVQFFRTHDDADVVYGDADLIDPQDRVIGRYPTLDWSWPHLLEVCFISQPSAFVRRRAVDRYGVLDRRLRYSNDYEYWVRLGKRGATFRHFPRVLSATRMHDACATLSRSEMCHREVNNLMRRHLGRVPDTWIYNYAHAFTRDRGIRDEQRFRFVPMLVASTLFASLKWNHRVSPECVKTLSTWLGGLFKELLHMGRCPK